MTAHITIEKRILFVLSCLVLSTMVASAQEIAPSPDLKLHYRELTQRQPLQFKMKDVGDLTRPVGILNWDFPPAEFAQLGFDTYPQTFCIEPLIPVVGGTTYGFNIDPFGQPRDFLGLQDDENGKRNSARRTKYVRELYGKNYSDLLKKPETYGPAFQTALWELISETDVPANQNSPFDLTKGTFQANYANLEAAPTHVQLAQTMLRGLTGDDASFGTNPDLAGRQLVRLNGVKDADGVLAQAQIGLRNIGGTSNVISGVGDSLGAVGPGGSAPIGGIGRSPLSGFGGLGGGIGGGIGGGGGFIGGGGTTGTTTPATSTTGTTNPVTTNTPITSTQNTGPTNPITTATTGTTNTTGTTVTTPTVPTTSTTPTTVTVTTSTGPTTSITTQTTQTTTTTGTTQTTNTTQTTSTTTTDPNPIPGPPAIVLSFVGVGVMGLFRRFRKPTISSN